MKPAVTTVSTLRRIRRILWVMAAVTLLALGGVITWRAGAWTAPEAPAGDRTGALGEPGLDLYPPDQRSPAPPLAGTTLDGRQLRLADLRGTIVVINVWGSWCAPCRAETPELVRLANENADRDVRFVGINTRDNPAAARAFVRRYQIPYPSVVDPDGQLLLSMRDVVPTSVVPSTVVVDRRSLVAARIIGRVTYNTLKGILDDELAAEADAGNVGQGAGGGGGG